MVYIHIVYLQYRNKPETMTLQENNTHKAVKENGQINIYIKGFEIEDYKCEDEFLYSIQLENEEDLFAIFERLDEDNRCLVAEANAAMTF